MKHLKLYEEMHKYQEPIHPYEGDYVLALDVNNISSNEIRDYISSHIGIINKEVGKTYGSGVNYIVRYHIEDINILGMFHKWNGTHTNLNSNFSDVELRPNEVTYWSDKKEELEILIQTDKYNI